MRAITVSPGIANSARLDEVPEPPPADGPILVRTVALGVCGTDREILSGAFGLAPPGEARLVLGHESLGRVEAAINEAILANYPVEVAYTGQKEAIEAGAMALFGEKYGDIVRTITVKDNRNGDLPYSFELCGGLHVGETGEIGLFRFIGEEAVGAGVRRVEAVTGRGAYEFVAERLNLLDRLAGKLNASHRAKLLGANVRECFGV